MGPQGGCKPPPGFKPGGMPPQQGVTLAGAYTLDGGKTATESSRHFVSNRDDVSAILVKAGASLSLQDATVATTGNSSNNENSSFYGLNAAVVASDGGRIAMEGGRIDSTGRGANGAFAFGKNSKVVLRHVAIRAVAAGGHGVDAAGGGTLELNGVDIETKGQSSAAVATDRGGGTITVTGGHFVTFGFRSPGLYSTGDLFVTGAKIRAEGAEAAVVEGANRIVLRNTDLSGHRERGVMIYQSFSGDALGQRGEFSMQGGSLTADEGPAFFVNNTTAVITLEKAAIKAPLLLEAKADRWGVKGKNGGHALITAKAQSLTGDLTTDAISSFTLTLKEGSVLSGAISHGSLNLDATSRWVVGADSSVVDLETKTLAAIKGNGHRVTYDPARPANAWLNGKTYSLSGGGTLQPQP